MGKSLKIKDQPPTENSTNTSDSASTTTVDNVTEKNSSNCEDMGDSSFIRMNCSPATMSFIDEYENSLNQPPPPTPAPRGVPTRRTGAMAEHGNQASPRESGATANNGNHSSYCDGNGTLGVGGNVTFYDQAIRQQSDQTFAAQFGASNKTFNASDFNNTTTNNTAGHHHGQAETTLGQAFGVGLGGPYPDLLAPNDLNATFLGRTLLNSQANQGAGVQIPVQSLATGYSSSMEPSAQGKNCLTIGNAGPIPMYRGSSTDETPKTSRKRKRQDPPFQQEQQSVDLLIQPFISMVTNYPDLPYGAKMGCVTSIEAVLNENRVNPNVLRGTVVNPVKSLVQEDFLNEMGKLLEIAIGNPSTSSHIQTVLKVLETVSSLSPEAKTLVQTCCFGPLNQLGNQINLVNKANELLGQLCRK